MLLMLLFIEYNDFIYEIKSWDKLIDHQKRKVAFDFRIMSEMGEEEQPPSEKCSTYDVILLLDGQ